MKYTILLCLMTFQINSMEEQSLDTVPLLQQLAFDVVYKFYNGEIQRIGSKEIIDNSIQKVFQVLKKRKDITRWLVYANKFACKVSFNEVTNKLISDLNEPASQKGAIKKRIEIFDQWKEFPSSVQTQINHREIKKFK